MRVIFSATVFAIVLLLSTICVFAEGGNTAVAPQFSENKGQWNDNVLYRLRFTTGAAFFEKDKVTFALTEETDAHKHHAPADGNVRRKHHSFQVHFENSNPQPTALGLQGYKHYENYFLGNEESKWAAHVRVFKAVQYESIYPGITLQYKGNNGHLEYVFFVEPHADPAQIKLRYEGVENLSVKNNALHYTTSVQAIREENLYAYQILSGEKKREVPCKFVVNGNTVSFAFPEGYNEKYPLVIDPTLIFSTFTGSTADNFGFTATYDNDGNLYAGGIVQDVGYPTTVGAYDRVFNGDWDVSISKFDSSGANLVYSTYLGGVESENPSSIVVDAQNELVVIGETSSADFPTTSNGFDRTFNFGVSVIYSSNGQNFLSGTDIFVTKLNAQGSALIGSTFLGGSNNDGLNDDQTVNHPLYYNYGDQFRGEVVVDLSGNVYGVSSTMSTDFPTTPGAFQTTSRGGQEAVVFKFNSTLTTLMWSSYLGGSGSDAGYNLVVDDATGNVYVSGGTASTNFPATSGSLNPAFLGGSADGFVAQISASGNAILSATYIGTNAYDQSYFIDNDGDGNIYIIGLTEGNYPVSPGVYSNPNSGQFLTKLTPNLATLLLSTVFGRGDSDPDISPTAFLVDNCRNIYIAGWGGPGLISLINNSPPASSTFGLPVTGNAYQPSTDGSDFYFMVLSRDASALAYATYFGSPSVEDHVDGGTSRFDKNGIMYQAVCAGCGSFSDFPTTPGAWSRTNNSLNCNEGLIKFRFELIGVDVSVSASPATVGCVPLTVTFNSNALNAKDFFWDFGNGDTSTVASPTYTFTDTGTYTVTLIGIDSTTCDNIIFSDTSTIPIRVRDDSVAAQFTPVIISNCDSFIVQLNSTSINAVSFFWNFGDGNTSTLVSPLHEYANPGTYTVSLVVTNSASCNGIDTLVQQVTLEPLIDAGITVPDSFGCVPFTVDFINSSVGGVMYDWDFGDGNISSDESPSHTYQDTGIFTVSLIIIDSASCNIADSATTTIRVSDSRVTTAFTMDTLSFECDSFTISLTNLSTNYTSLLWDFGDGTTSTLENPTHVYTTPDSFTIRLVASNPNACNATDTSSQLIFQPNNVVAIFEAASGCPPFSLSITNSSINATRYEWTFWDGTTSVDSVPTFGELETGTYPLTLTAYNPLTCNDSSTTTGSFTVYGRPAAYFTTSDSLYALNEDIVFLNESSPGVYLWNFDDGTTSDLPDSVIHAYVERGEYNPCITVTDSNGCDSTYCKQLRIDFVGIIDVPNAFSPNGDNFNDVLFVRGLGVTEIEFKIYNRWGELVFETNDIAIVCNELQNCIRTKGWDGTYKNEKQEMDVYVYTLDATFENGEETGVRKGNITLIR